MKMLVLGIALLVLGPAALASPSAAAVIKAASQSPSPPSASEPTVDVLMEAANSTSYTSMLEADTSSSPLSLEANKTAPSFYRSSAEVSGFSFSHRFFF